MVSSSKKAVAQPIKILLFLLLKTLYQCLYSVKQQGYAELIAADRSSFLNFKKLLTYLINPLFNTNNLKLGGR